jgi:RNA polymerase sigma-70 factor (ECF subfamily)
VISSYEEGSLLRGLPDRDLVRLSRSGRSDAFGELVTRHQQKIYNVVVRFCGHAEDAADITQRAFLNAYRKIGDFKGDSAFSTWIYRIAFNQAVSFRRENRRPMASLDDGDDRAPFEPADPRAPEASLESEEAGKKVRQALHLLNDDDRRIILLKDLQGCSYEEIAAILKIPKGTVRSRLHRARLELKEKLKPILGTLP